MRRGSARSGLRWPVTAAALALLAGAGAARAEDRPPLPGGGERSPFRVLPFERPVEDADSAPEARQSRAAELADEGFRALEARAWETAARRLEASYGLSADPELLPPLARALERLGQHAAAAERLERYLEEAEGLEAETRVSLGLELRSLRRRVARVTVGTEPPGARVSLDGRELGATPLEPFVLDHGTYRLEARLEGYADVGRELAVAGGMAVDVLLRLEPVRSDGSRRPRSRALDGALWTLVGLAAGSAVALAVTGGLAIGGFDDLARDPDPAPGDVRRALSLAHAGFGLVGVTSATAAGALTLALVRARQGGGDGAD